MTIRKILDSVKGLKPNNYDEPQLVKWLDTLDRNIYKNVIATHEGAEIDHFDGYDDNTILDDTELLADETYYDMYVFYLCGQIDLYNRENNGYNNYISLYDAQYKDYEAWYNRTHTPIQTAREVYF